MEGKWKNELALFLSDFLTPLEIIVFSVLCWEAENSLILIASATVFFALIPEWVFAKLGTRKGSSGNQRLVMQSQFLASLVIGMVLLVVFGAPKAALAYAVAFSIGQLTVLLFVPVWKISGHAFGASTSLYFLYSVGFLHPIVALALLLAFGWGRVGVGAHTPAQYVAGSTGGIILAMIASAAV